MLSNAETTGNASPPEPFPEFNTLSKVVRVYQPPPPTEPIDTKAPTTILLCSWMDANPKHIAYYTKKYMELYPQARLILATMNLQQLLVQSETSRRLDAQEAVTALLSPPQENERLFVHSLSNGGAKRVYNIAAAYQKVTGKPLPIQAYVIDSAPGIPQFRRDLHILSLPGKRMNWFAWVPFMSVVLTVTSVLYITINWMPKWVWRELVWGPQEGIADYSLIDKRAVKGFIYSKDDLAIDWQHVEKYAKMTEEKGYKVEMKLVEDAQHVQLFKGKGGEEDYWGFVEKIWGMSQSS